MFFEAFSESTPRIVMLGERDRPGRRVVRLAPRFLADGLRAIFLRIGGLARAVF
jgi:hypothetical protein